MKEQPKKHVEDNSTVKWLLSNGDYHREDGPAIIWADGSKEWYRYDKKHREDGPAVIWADGYTSWYTNDKRHRNDGPAVTDRAGYRAWFYYDKRHRLDGPAVIFSDGRTEYWFMGKRVNEGDFEYTLIRRKEKEKEGKNNGKS
jgi:hypothetical protein